jgi:hypothetical protein
MNESTDPNGVTLYRIKNIELTATKDHVKQYLERYEELILDFRLAPYDSQTQVAVVKFSQSPKAFRIAARGVQTVTPEESHLQNQVFVDTRFDGITPIFVPQAESPAASLNCIEVE